MNRKELETRIREAVIWSEGDTDCIWIALPGLGAVVRDVYTCPGCGRTGITTGTCRACGAWISPPATHVLVTVPEYKVEVMQRLDTLKNR